MSNIFSLFGFLKSKKRESVSAECQQQLSDALVGKTIERVVQVPSAGGVGWFIIYLGMTDKSAIHIVVPQLDSCMRVQLNKVDGSQIHLPEMKE